ncbi:MAG: hypothetical protein COX81_01575 [Candidatus Magasanikbacteria bacterium CG_4_10_14_0_2_um_filter_37_12]|uniref:SMC-Scp complex subunit ScpB n=1 Tax=Candidatus Magasanikbacteria bacterium CG_4_10_14_0_2_um_filter_37_12 TaxID=1974637 RepID=A0A2M7V8L6_9BACT|nr:MAG: hypothetical protein COX81_01575 [Candidatus Magasanikbacteria bacterium CG_4_10_14_0_2_um_filter_37_12]
MSSLLSQIESILFIASKPLSCKKIAKAVGKMSGEVAEAIETLQMKYNQGDSGIHLLVDGETVQMATNPDNTSVIEEFIKDQTRGELTKAQLETLTVIAYRSPVTRPELEQIRGVNCAVIIRNLLIRGLVKEKTDGDALLPEYSLSMEALSNLGINNVSELNNYEELHVHENVESVIGNSITN